MKKILFTYAANRTVHDFYHDGTVRVSSSDREHAQSRFAIEYKWAWISEQEAIRVSDQDTWWDVVSTSVVDAYKEAIGRLVVT